ncbi:MAG: hypothetical protein K2J70_06885 [Muribaculaceae bacterium]|nr:hypothetical protein [Muribaculaceae bacterium]
MTSNRFFQRYLPLLLLPASALLSTPESHATVDFRPSSVLSTGKWVKVRVSETGVHEISYDTLRKMGFSDPEKVGVYGKGGTALPISFHDGATRLVFDDLDAVPLIHDSGRILFYGRSTEEIKFRPTASQFERVSKNIYSTDGTYFLSDSASPLLMEKEGMDPGNLRKYSSGYDYEFHEEDLYQNNTRSGQLFWGESLLTNPDNLVWKYSLPYLDVAGKAKFECKVYAADKSTGTFSYGIKEATSGNRDFAVKHPVSAGGDKVNPEYVHMNTPVLSLSVPTKEISIYTTLDAGSGDFINLDYWLLTYPKKLPDLSLPGKGQERLSVKVTGTRPGYFTIPGGEDMAIMDVTDPKHPVLLYSETIGDDTRFTFPYAGSYKDFIFLKPSARQIEITGFEPVSNSDLHARAAEGPDFVIITVPSLRGFSERLADLHRKYDGIDVMVATTDEVYNEFSGGSPDPMAYRGLMKMAYEASGGRMKNLLLVGKVYGNFTEICRRGEDREYIIGFQENKVNDNTHAANMMDFYGIADDFTYSTLQNNRIDVGVGLLPLFNDREADAYLRKVERYLADNDRAFMVNEFLSIGGTGDNHTHDRQAVELAEYADLYAPLNQAATYLAIDAFGEKESKRKIFSDLHRGKMITFYTGHGTWFGIESTKDVCKVRDIPSFKNEKNGFMIILGCDLSDTDNARKGFGEQIVTDTEYGMLGCMMSTRTVWSGQNFELGKLISEAFYAEAEKIPDSTGTSLVSKYRDKTPTFGEIYSDAKTKSNYSNSLNYNYIGDPALKVYVPLRGISSNLDGKTAAPGGRLRFSGSVLDRDIIRLDNSLNNGSDNLTHDNTFNGKIVAKVFSPLRTMISADYITHSKDNGGKELELPEPEIRLGDFTTEVKNGEYTFDFQLPASAAEYAGEDLRILLSAFDPEKDLAASGSFSVTLAGSPAPADKDMIAPAINAVVEDSDRMINVTVSDAGGVMKAAVAMAIDGKACQQLCLNPDNEVSSTLDFTLFTDAFSIGDHILTVEASDVAGNHSEKSYTFNVSATAAPLTIVADRKVAAGEILFSSPDAPKGASLTIRDHNGETVFTTLLEKGGYRWNCTGTDGRTVPEGLYRASISAAGDDASRLFTDSYPFAVMR